MDLEQLMNIRVTSVQRKEQSLARSAAAVTVITREDMRRAGISTLPEALRLAPGVHVARVDSGAWAIGARGFNGQFANKLLVMVDGRSAYHPMNSGVFWDGLDLMLDDVERIEVIRGPGAVMWGANAVNGVINIITRRAEDTLGGYAEGGTGTEDRMLGRVRWGQRWKDGLAWRLSGQYGRRNKLESEEGGRGGEEESPWSSGRLAFRLDWDRGRNERLEVFGSLQSSRYSEFFSLPAAVPGGRMGVHSDIRNEGGSAMARWLRPMKGGLTTTQFSYWDLNVHRTEQLTGRTHVADLDVQHRRRVAGRHEMVAGVGIRGISDHSIGSSTARFEPDAARYYTAQFTLQDEWEAVRNRLFVSGGFRAEYNSLSGANLQPTARALWALGTNHSIWGAVSRAVRTPSRTDLHLHVNVDTVATPLGMAVVERRPSPFFESEKQRSYEIGYRQALGRVSWDLTAFWNQYRDYGGLLPTGFGLDPATRAPVAFLDLGNLTRGHGYGTEVSAHLDVTRTWRVTGSLTQYRSMLRPNGKPGPGMASSVEVVPDVFPRVRTTFLSSYQLGRRWQLNGIWYATGALSGQPQTRSHHRLDANVQWRASEWGGASMGVQNVTGGRIYEFKPEDGSASDPMGRALFVRWQWWF